MKNNLMFLCKSAILIALYVVLTVFLAPISYGVVQFRVGEVLILFCFFNKKYSIPLVIGCLVANIFSPFPLDILFGTLGTLGAVMLIMFTKNIWVASIWPALTNGILVTVEIIILDTALSFDFITFISIAGSIALGELVVVTVLGVPLFLLLQRQPQISKLLEINKKSQTVDEDVRID